ncbi:hypothetical protein [Halobacteriovorax sp. HLS]|uniref:hypothetical protein n=1 Tax=Halobacteriovorax sp. HLS TaxID=2234000 RepID=UPI000FD735AB|nr:hypothetical protein [Halobacteriovorax sp. HLS]
MSDLFEDVILTENCLKEAQRAGITIRQVFEVITFGCPWVTDLGGLSFYYNGIEVLTCASCEYAIAVIDHGQDLSHQVAHAGNFVSLNRSFFHEALC